MDVQGKVVEGSHTGAGPSGPGRGLGGPGAGVPAGWGVHQAGCGTSCHPSRPQTRGDPSNTSFCLFLSLPSLVHPVHMLQLELLP